MNIIPMFMKCPVELPMYPSLGLSPNAFQHPVRSGGKSRASLLHKYLSVDVKHTRLHLHVSVFVQMGQQVGCLLDRIDSDSRLVWGVPGRDIEALFLGEETVRKSEGWKGGFTEGQWVEKKGCMSQEQMAVQEGSVVILFQAVPPRGVPRVEPWHVCPHCSQEAEQELQECKTQKWICGLAEGPY